MAPPRPSLYTTNQLDRTDETTHLKKSTTIIDRAAYSNNETNMTNVKNETKMKKHNEQEMVIAEETDQKLPDTTLKGHSETKNIQSESDRSMSYEMEIYKNTIAEDCQSILSSCHQPEQYGQIAFSIKFDFENGNRLIFNVIDCIEVPSYPLASHPYIKGKE